MLKYKFQSYYKDVADQNRLVSMIDYWSSSDFTQRFKINDEAYRRIDLRRVVQEFNTRISIQGNFRSLSNWFNNGSSSFSYYSTSANLLFISLTNVMFLKEVCKNPKLIKPNMCIKIGSHYLNFNVPQEAKGSVISKQGIEYQIGEEPEYCHSSLYRNAIAVNHGLIGNLELMVKDDYFSVDYCQEIMFLYLKCALICSQKEFEYSNIISRVKHRISGSRIPYTWINSVKKLENTDIFNVINGDTTIYSKSKTVDNIYLSIQGGCFISKFETYSNLKSIQDTDTIVGRFESVYENGIELDKIIISNAMLDYFDFLKLNKKNEIYKSDYNKLNKVFNAIKSISVLKNVPIEFNDIEKNIYSTEITIDETNITKHLLSDYCDLIPGNVEQAIAIKTIFDELLSNIQFIRDISRKYAFDSNSIFSPFSKATFAEMEYAALEDEVPF